MSDFEKALAHTLQFEGGYAHNPADRGGETFRGVSRKNWPRWAGWDLIDEVKARGARTARLINAAFEGDPKMAALVADFYRHNFWRPFEPLEAPGRIMGKLFDTAVNFGPGGALKLLQKTVNRLEPDSRLAVDGRLGPKTLAAFGLVLELAGAEDRFLEVFCQEQEAQYRRIVDRSPSQGQFLKGWLRRAAWLPQ